MSIHSLSLSRLFVVALIAFGGTFATYIATAMQNSTAVTIDQLMQVLAVQSVKGLSIAASASLASIIAFFTRPDAVMPANSLTSAVQEVKKDASEEQ
jgi:hypothetical protein